MNGTAENGALTFPLEYTKDIVDDIAKREKLTDYELNVISGFAKGENYLGVIHRVQVNGKKANGENETLHLIMKSPPVNAAIRDHFPLNSFYQREVFAYKVFLPEIDKIQRDHDIDQGNRFNFVKCYDACSKDLTEVLVFEDMNTRGFKMYDRLKAFDYDHTILVIKTIANLHALSFAAKECNKKLYEETRKIMALPKDFGETFPKLMDESKDRIVNIIEDPQIKKKMEKFGDGLYEKLLGYLDLTEGSDDSYNIITHGDCWINNFLFKYEEGKPVDMVMLDWQILRISSPIIDLSYMIFSSTDEELRAKHLDDIFDTYYSHLSSRLRTLGCDPEVCYPETVFRRHLKEKLLNGLIWSFMIVPLVLSNRNDAKDLNDMIDENGPNLEIIKMSDACVHRLRGVIKDFVKYEML